MMISVAMAVYNGEKYLKDQLNSILSQIGEDDEIIISYNPSIDKTLDIIENYKKYDKRIKCFICNDMGVISNFENALMHCTGNIIFLSDQDDIWKSNKVEKVIRCFDNKEILAVLHNTEVVDENLIPLGKSLFDNSRVKKGVIRNIVKNSFQGSCLAFRSCLMNKICPIPKSIAMHDQWIGILAEYYGETLFIEDKLILYRRHSQTVTEGKINIMRKFYFIFLFIVAFFKRTILKDKIR